MKVVMLKQTVYAGLRSVGDLVDVQSEVARRWLSNGIAGMPVPDAEAPAKDVDPYEGKKAKELYEMCKAAGLDVKERQNRDYYIGALEDKVDADASASNNVVDPDADAEAE